MAATRSRFGKPNVYAMPPELGKRVLKTIRETPPYDYEKARQESKELHKQIELELEKHRNDGR